MFRFLVATVSIVLSLGSSPAKLFVHKTTPTDPVVEGRDFVIVYNLYNQGERAAHDVELIDRYDPKSFEIKGGNPQEDGTVTLNVDEVLPGEHKTVNITVAAKLYGMYDSTRANVRYTSPSDSSDEDNEDADVESDEDTFQGFSSSLTRTKILSKEDYQRISFYYAQDWIVLVLITAVTTVVPFATWRAKKLEAASFTKKRKSN